MLFFVPATTLGLMLAPAANTAALRGAAPVMQIQQMQGAGVSAPVGAGPAGGMARQPSQHRSVKRTGYWRGLGVAVPQAYAVYWTQE